MTLKTTATGLDPTNTNTQPFSQIGQFDQTGKLQRKTLLLLCHFLILDLLNTWYNCTSSAQKFFWNYVRKMTNCLHTLGKNNKNLFYRRKITYGQDPFNVSIAFGHFSQKWNFVVFWKKNRGMPRIPRKSSCWVVGAHTKKKEKKYLLKFGTYPKYHGIVQWNLLKFGTYPKYHGIVQWNLLPPPPPAPPAPPRLAMRMWNGEKEVNFFVMCQFIIHQRLK